MSKRTIYVREEDEALFDKLAEDGKLSAVIARAVKADRGSEAPEKSDKGRTRWEATPKEFVLSGPADPGDVESVGLYQTSPGQLLEFTVEPQKNKESVFTHILVDPITFQVGRKLLSLVDPKQGAKLLERVTAIRRHIAVEWGIVLPGVRFRDNLKFPNNAYSISIREVEAARGEVQVNHFLVVGPKAKIAALHGTKTVEPTYGMPAVWIEPKQKEEAQRLAESDERIQILDPVSVIATHLTEVIRAYIAVLLGLEEASALLKEWRKSQPTLVAAAIPGCLSMVQFWQVLRGLLSERISIRDIPLILESVVSLPPEDRQVGPAIEAARLALRRQICREYSSEGTLKALQLHPSLEGAIKAQASDLEIPLLAELSEFGEVDTTTIIVTSPELRAPLRKLLQRSSPRTVILSQLEIVPEIKLKRVGLLGTPAHRS